MTNPVIPPLTPSDKDKMPILNSATNPVLQMKFKPFIFEPEKLKPGETGSMLTANSDHPYKYQSIRPILDTYTFRHKITGFFTTAPPAASFSRGEMYLSYIATYFVPEQDTFRESTATTAKMFISTERLASHMIPGTSHAVYVQSYYTNSKIHYSLEVGMPRISVFNYYHNVLPVGIMLPKPGYQAAPRFRPNYNPKDSVMRWEPLSSKIRETISAITPMQHNIIPELDAKTFGIKVRLGDHASIFDQTVTPRDTNYKHNEHKPAIQKRLTIIDSNGGYIQQSVSDPNETLVAGKLQDSLRNGSPAAMTTDQFALHPLFYSATVDAHGNPSEGVLYMQIGQVVYNKPPGSNGLFFVEEYMLEESLGNFIRADLVRDTAAFIGFFVCGEGVGSIGDAEIIVASDGLSRSAVDPAPPLPADPVNNRYVTYHDGGYHTDGVPAASEHAFFVQQNKEWTPVIDFGDKYKQFKLRLIYGDPRVPHNGDTFDDFWHIELINNKHPNGVSSKDAGSDAAKLKKVLAFVATSSNSRCTPLWGNMHHGTIFGGANGSWRDEDDLGVDAFGLRFQYNVDVSYQDAANLLWGVTTPVHDDIIPVFFDFNIKINTLIESPLGGTMDAMVDEDSVFSYSFLKDSGMSTVGKAHTSLANWNRFYSNRGGEHAGNFGMFPFAAMKDSSGTSLGYYSYTESLNTGKLSTLTDPVHQIQTLLPFVNPLRRDITLKIAGSAGEIAYEAGGIGVRVRSGYETTGGQAIPTSGDKNLFTAGSFATQRTSYLAMNRKPPRFPTPPELQGIMDDDMLFPSYQNTFSRYCDPLLVAHSLLSQGIAHETVGVGRPGFTANQWPKRKFVYEYEAGGYMP